MSSNGKILVVKGSGGAGLGDRMRSVLSAILYAKLSERALYIDWNDGAYSGDTSNVFPRLFELRHVRQAENIPVTDSIRPSIWRMNIEKSLDELYVRQRYPGWDRGRTIETFSFDQSRLDYPEDVLVMWEFDQFSKMRKHYRGCYAHFSEKTDQEIMRILLRENLILQSDIRNEIETFKKRQFSDHVIGVHIRRTKEATKAHRVSMRRYYKCIDSILTRQPDAKVFLATDNARVMEEFGQAFHGIIRTNKWFGMPGESLHLNEACPDRFQNAVDALTDMYLLAECQYLVCLKYSSFSIIAQLLSNAAPENIIALEGGKDAADLTKMIAKSFIPQGIWGVLKDRLNKSDMR